MSTLTFIRNISYLILGSRRRWGSMRWTTRSRRRPRSSGSTTPPSAGGSRSPRSRTNAPTLETSSEKKVGKAFSLEMEMIFSPAPSNALILYRARQWFISKVISGGNFHTLVLQKIKSMLSKIYTFFLKYGNRILCLMKDFVSQSFLCVTVCHSVSHIVSHSAACHQLSVIIYWPLSSSDEKVLCGTGGWKYDDDDEIFVSKKKVGGTTVVEITF